MALPGEGGRADAGRRKADDGRTDVRVIERQGQRQDEHFTEGEPDLEPPEELAVLEVDEESLLEKDLETRADLENEVDIDVLESMLDHLVHDGDDEDDGDDDLSAGDDAVAMVGGDLEIEELEDREESLDRILQEKLAGDEEHGGDLHELAIDTLASAAEVRMSACGAREFVCSSCFTVRNRTQRAGASGSLCRDCGD
jgi:hypothetical protein